MMLDGMLFAGCAVIFFIDRLVQMYIARVGIWI